MKKCMSLLDDLLSFRLQLPKQGVLNYKTQWKQESQTQILDLQG
jgi:hypothetical protein